METCCEGALIIGESCGDSCCLEGLVGENTVQLEVPSYENKKSFGKRVYSKFQEFFDDWFYFKESVGKGGEIIKVLKIRTLNRDADKHHSKALEKGMDENGKIDMSKHVIPSRKRLRENQFDELPQLFYNVLWKRDMKWVGVRPVKGETFIEYPKDIRENYLGEKPAIGGVNYSSWGNTAHEKIRIYFDRKKKEKFVDLKYGLNIAYNKIFGKVKSH